MDRYAPRLAFGLMGAVFLVSQVLVLRTFLLVFQGNEFSVGIVLGNWFLLEALGSWFWGKRAARAARPRVSFVRVQILLSLLLPATLAAALASRYLPGGSPWEALGPLSMLGLSGGLLLPLALGNGAAFVYGCRLLEGPRDAGGEAPGRAYLLEAAGACVGGVAFTFLVVGRLSAMETAFALGALNLSSALCLLRGEGRRARRPAALLLAGFAAGLVLNPAGSLQRWTMQLRWLPFDLESSSDSIYGNLSVLREGGERILVQNGLPVIALPHPDVTALEERVHLPLLAHPAPREVLLLGGGPGGGLSEALKHPVRRVVALELDPLLLRTVAELAPPETRRELEDPRVEVVNADGRAFLRETPARVDAILVDLPDPSTLQLNRFFTEGFFRLARERLRPGGVLSVSLSGSSTYLGEELARMNRCLLHTLRAVFPFVRVLPGERNLFLASTGPDLDSLDARTVEARLRARAVSTRAVQARHLEYKMDPARERWLMEELDAAPAARINRDFSPALVSHVLAHRNAEVERSWRGAVLALERVGVPAWVRGLALPAVPLALLLAWGARGRARALGGAIFTTGLAAMAVEMIVILSFQSVYGFLYHWIGVLVAVFMAGLSLGAWAATRLLGGPRDPWRLLLAAEGVLACLLFLVAWGAAAGGHAGLAYGPESGRAAVYALLALNLLAGLLAGGEFPLAVHVAARGAADGAVPAAGRLYALDLAGAWLGTFLVSVVWVPLLGFQSTLLLAGVIKLAALAALVLAAFRGRGRPGAGGP